MASIFTLALICATIVLCMHQRGRTRVRLAEIAANAAPIILHADANTGEILDTDGGHIDADPDDVPNLNHNQRTGKWLDDNALIA